MDTVVIDGVTYTKAGVLAKEFHYTTDYIGQLCRGEKVDAQLVGRSWYVSRESLEEHASKRIEAIRQDEMSLENNPFLRDGASPMMVSAPLSKITKKMLNTNPSPYVTSQNYSVAKYESDSVDLLPVMQIRHPLPKVKIKEASPAVISPLITKVNIDDSFAVPINQQHQIKVKAINNNNASLKPNSVRPMLKSAVNHAPFATKPLQSVASSEVLPLAILPTKLLSFTPSSVMTLPQPSRKVPYGALMVGLVILGFGVVLSTLMLDLEVYYDGSISSTSFSINQTALLNFFK